MMTRGSIIVLLLFKTHLELDMIKVKCFFYDVVKHIMVHKNIYTD